MKATSPTTWGLICRNISQINVPQVGRTFGYNDLLYDYGSSYAVHFWLSVNPDGSLGSVICKEVRCQALHWALYSDDANNGIGGFTT